MTSRLRRKPPTTARSTHSIRTSSAPAALLAAFRLSYLFSRPRFGSLIAALLIGLLAATGSRPARAIESRVTTAVHTVDSGSDDSAVRTVSYSTGEAGRRVPWLPYRPSKEDLERDSRRRAGDETTPRASQCASPVAARAPNGDTPDPFDDPFEDAKTAQQSPLTGPVTELLIEAPDVDLDSLGPPVEIPESLLEESLAAAPRVPEDPCSAAELKSISEITHDISPKGDLFPKECPLQQGPLPDRQIHGWAPITFTWKASGLCHKPAYFEEVHLEQYGHTCRGHLQPLISGAHFFLTVPILPYKMGLYPPQECIYSLGYYRPGSCAPYMLDPLPLSIRAGLAEAGVWTGMAFLVP